METPACAYFVPPGARLNLPYLGMETRQRVPRACLCRVLNLPYLGMETGVVQSQIAWLFPSIFLI